MGKYNKFQAKGQVKTEMHPVWRGIGCLLIVIIPVISFFIMLAISPAILKSGYVPYQLTGYIHFPDWMFRNQITTTIATFLGSLENVWANLLIFIVVLVVLAGVIWLIYSALYQVMGPPRYTEVDAPPSSYKAKKYTR